MAYLLRKIQIAITVVVIMITGVIQGSDLCVPECCCSPCGQFFLEAEMLYLRAFEGGLSSACDGTQIVNSTAGGLLISTLTGEGNDPDFQWDLGFRIGVGYEFANNPSAIGVYWTYYNSPTCDEDRERSWNILFNVVDVLWESPWLASCPMNAFFTLFGGLRCASINQKLFTNFASTIDGSLTTSTGKLKEDFLGIGPLFGIEGESGIWCGFSFYGNVAIGILYGRFHVRSTQTSIFDTGVNIDYLGKHLQACQPVVDAGIGLCWERCFCNCALLVLQLGLEHHSYFNQNQFCSYGDLNLDGVSLGVSILY